MQRTLFALLIATILGTSGAQAAPLLDIDFQLADGNGFIGLAGLQARVDSGRLTVGDCFAPGAACRTIDEFTHYTITSGPLVDVHLDEDPFTHTKLTVYTFEEGLLQVDFKWTNADGLEEAGGFTAPVFNLVNPSGRFLRSTVEECDLCGGDVGHHTQDRFRVGSGLLDANVARWLGVEREAHGDEFNFYLELLNGDETSARRDGNLNNPGLFLSAAPVPEPATGVLLLGGIAGM